MFDLPDWQEFLAVSVRIVIAAFLGAILGLEREREGKAAGLRTHTLVSLGAAVFVLASTESGVTPTDMSRVIQGIATGVGFIGAGTILKLAKDQEIRGLTTAASVWLTAAIGIAVGLGRVWIPVCGVVMALVVLRALRLFEDAEQHPPGKDF
jgi:putative Mg2+ transporter-C (MgtC) family protein